jgi:hypothetical protein
MDFIIEISKDLFPNISVCLEQTKQKKQLSPLLSDKWILFVSIFFQRLHFKDIIFSVILSNIYIRGALFSLNQVR